MALPKGHNRCEGIVEPLLAKKTKKSSDDEKINAQVIKSDSVCLKLQKSSPSIAVKTIELHRMPANPN